MQTKENLSFVETRNRIPFVKKIDRANPLFLINSNSHYLNVRTAIAEFYGMNNSKSLVATFNQALEKARLRK